MYEHIQRNTENTKINTILNRFCCVTKHRGIWLLTLGTVILFNDPKSTSKKTGLNCRNKCYW